MFDFTNKHVHPTYEFARDSEESEALEIRELCYSMWKEFKPYADQNFLTELSIDFESRFWEMDLACGLLNNGFIIESSNSGPDIKLINNKSNIWIEAIAPDNGQGPDQVPDHRHKPGKKIKARSVPDEQIILRFTSAINEKFLKYERYLEKGVVKNDEPYVIAINSQKLHCQTDFFPPRIVRSVFPFGSYQVTLNRKSLEIVNEGFEYRQSINKVNLEPISIDMFLDIKYSGISAVLFSSADCINRPKKIVDSFIVVHNPYAKNPIPKGFFKFGIEFFVEKNTEGQFQLKYYEYR